MTKEDICRAVQDVRERIAQSAQRAGRDADEITLLAVSKFMPPEYIQWARECGIEAFGENRAQELRNKEPLFEGCKWHFIGQLQKNKLKYVVGKAVLIQSVDSLQLMQGIDELAQRREVCQSVLVEINIAGERAKGGIAPEQLEDFLRQGQGYEHVHIEGLMCVPPADLANVEGYFAQMKQLYDDMRARGYDLNVLSMGMSGDFECAIAHGATMVRVGSAIFGSRVV